MDLVAAAAPCRKQTKRSELKWSPDHDLLRVIAVWESGGSEALFAVDLSDHPARFVVGFAVLPFDEVAQWAEQHLTADTGDPWMRCEDLRKMTAPADGDSFRSLSARRLELSLDECERRYAMAFLPCFASLDCAAPSFLTLVLSASLFGRISCVVVASTW